MKLLGIRIAYDLPAMRLRDNFRFFRPHASTLKC